MKIEDFIIIYSNEYMDSFFDEKKSKDKKKPLNLSTISKFLFEPRYKVEGIKFSSVG